MAGGFLSAKQDDTRFVMGIQTSNFPIGASAMISQPVTRTVPALAFVEHVLGNPTGVYAKLRVGMFWERLGYIEPYDTYLIGRTHTAGSSVKLKLHRMVEVSGGLGVHSRNFLQNDARSTRLAWARFSTILGNARLNLYAVDASTEDDDYQYASEIDKSRTGELNVYGAEALYKNKIISAQLILAFYDAKEVKYLGNALELLHSEGGYWLKEHFLGHTNENGGTGEIQTTGFDIKLGINEALSRISMGNPWLAGWHLRGFGMTAWVATAEDDTSADTVDENGRVYFKWGSDLRLMFKPLGKE